MSNGQFFVLAIIGMSTLGWMFTSWVRAKHGYPVENEWGGSTAKGYDGLDEDYPNAVRKIQLLTTENETLIGRISRLEERIAVLERIATDPAERTAREIDALR
ncbi:MAG: hypothetical protein K2W81_03270 [Sphingomonas sp.]|uniref:hypothetical protein n=1 Tax=Sphingomonas sp. TaxID=28214 RepID=UPI0025F788A2|nr:hypothetical protein [Sphingomonas sp.]MBY0282970.1 hypothetical protein [Sphingomonas sp.]